MNKLVLVHKIKRFDPALTGCIREHKYIDHIGETNFPWMEMMSRWINNSPFIYPYAYLAKYKYTNYQQVPAGGPSGGMIETWDDLKISWKTRELLKMSTEELNKLHESLVKQEDIEKNRSENIFEWLAMVNVQSDKEE